MLLSPRLPELNQRDRFVKRAAASRMIYAVSGEEGLGRVPSQRHRGREVTLFWTNRKAAERWADVIARQPQIKVITLDAMLCDVLPALTRLNRLAGPDWGSDPIEPELDATDLAGRLKREVLDGFVERVAASRKVYMLDDASGPALLVSAVQSDRLLLPCWSDRAFAEARIGGPWADMVSVEVPLQSFAHKTLRWLEDRGWLVAPDHMVGPGATEIAPATLSARFKV